MDGMVEQARQERDQAEQRADALQREVAELRPKLTNAVLMEVAS